MTRQRSRGRGWGYEASKAKPKPTDTMKQSVLTRPFLKLASKILPFEIVHDSNDGDLDNNGLTPSNRAAGALGVDE